MAQWTEPSTDFLTLNFRFHAPYKTKFNWNTQGKNLSKLSKKPQAISLSRSSRVESRKGCQPNKYLGKKILNGLNNKLYKVY